MTSVAIFALIAASFTHYLHFSCLKITIISTDSILYFDLSIMILDIVADLLQNLRQIGLLMLHFQHLMSIVDQYSVIVALHY